MDNGKLFQTITNLTSYVAEVNEMGLTPEIAKRLSEIESSLKDIQDTISYINMPTPVKSGLEATIANVAHSIAVIKLELSSDMTSSSVTGKPEIHLVEFSLYPASKQIEIKGIKHKLAPAEFKILYRLAESVNTAVAFESDQSLLTRLSVIRRTLPTIKPLIETLGDGNYILHGKKK